MCSDNRTLLRVLLNWPYHDCMTNLQVDMDGWLYSDHSSSTSLLMVWYSLLVIYSFHYGSTPSIHQRRQLPSPYQYCRALIFLLVCHTNPPIHSLNTGPIASALTNIFGCRNVVIAGCVLSCLAFLSSAVAPSILFLYASFGLVGGVSPNSLLSLFQASASAWCIFRQWSLYLNISPQNDRWPRELPCVEVASARSSSPM